jgi:LysR family transcriptional regulator, carnitine catabolism transcriptional activator
MDLRRLRLFLGVVDEGGFTRAAEAMFVSQPSVSQAMRELEDELGTPLFHRVGRGVVLTSAGEALVGPARQVLRDVEVGEAAVAAVTGLVTGRLDLCSLPTLAVDPVAPLVGAFRLAYPGVTLALADPDDSADLVHLVSTGECELGVDAQAAPGRLESLELGSQDLLAVFPPGTLAPRGAIGIDRLAEFSLVTSPEGTSTRRLLDDACASAGVTPQIAVVTAQREAILPLVLAGAGATLLARPLAETARRLGAVIAPLRPRVSRMVYILHRVGPLSPAAQAFLHIAGL